MSEWNSALEEAARLADAYAEENLRMAGDTILLDPILSGGRINSANLAKSRDLQINSCVHSSMFHAAQNIAAAIRQLRR